MSFLHPGWLLLGLIIPLLVLGAVLAYRSRGKAWRQLVAPRLRQHLVKEVAHTHHWLSLALGLIGCALLIMVIARPYQGNTTTTEEVRTRNILIAVDTSRSMLVRDGSPDRMATAKAMALEITNAFPNDRIGLIAFSGTSVLLAPMTIDHTSIRDTIGQLDTEIIPSGGSNLASAAKTALNTFKKISHNSNAMIIISDGEDHSQAIDAVATDIRNGKFAVSTVGIGTREGGMIPDPRFPDGKYRDARGNTVHSRMIPDALQTLAKAGGGTFISADSDAPDTIRDSLAFLESNQQEGRQVSLPNEKFQYFLIPAILCLIGSMVTHSNIFSSISTTPVAACLLLLLTVDNLHAATHLERAVSAYENKEYQTAHESFEKALDEADGEDRRAVQFSLGSTAYRLNKWPQASNYFSQSLLSSDKKLRESSHYNIGNTLFQSAWSLFKPAEEPNQNQPDNNKTYQLENLTSAITQLEDAIAHYTAAIGINPEHGDAKHNRSEAEKLLEQLKQQQKKKDKENDGQPQQGKGDQPKEKGDKPDQSPDQKGSGDQQGENPDQNDQQNPPDQPDQGDAKEPENGEQPAPPDKQYEQQPGESDEAYAARILKENSDAETRPVKSRFLRMRRPAKDW